jgi:cbb3-type cytochrome oxidase subunit 3
LALFFLLLVLFIVILAVVFMAFPPQRVAEWLTRGSKKK